MHDKIRFTADKISEKEQNEISQSYNIEGVDSQIHEYRKKYNIKQIADLISKANSVLNENTPDQFSWHKKLLEGTLQKAKYLKSKKVMQKVQKEIRLQNKIESDYSNAESEIGNLNLVYSEFLTYTKYFKNYLEVLDNLKQNIAYREVADTKLYYIRIRHNNTRYYKIGITNHSVKERYSKKNFSKIDKIIFETPLKYAKQLETVILTHFVKDKTLKPAIFPDGYSEVFNHDVLKLDLDKG